MRSKRAAELSAAEHNALGAAFYSSGAVGLAVEQFRVSVRLAPQCAEYWGNLGASLTDVGDLDEAKRALLISDELAPGRPSVHFHLGLLFRKLSEIDSAEREFRKVISLDSDGYLTKRSREFLSKTKPKIILGLSGTCEED
ncbi:MAG: hypothetical protein KF736_12085 [Acidobacteria bacterium]|nr:hypothetical protein [Acidobacteriota bacterium]MCW5948812.1 hypothetical protein [Pyrinomonadaceae bacterium]